MEKKVNLKEKSKIGRKNRKKIDCLFWLFDTLILNYLSLFYSYCNKKTPNLTMTALDTTINNINNNIFKGPPCKEKRRTAIRGVG